MAAWPYLVRCCRYAGVLSTSYLWGLFSGKMELWSLLSKRSYIQGEAEINFELVKLIYIMYFFYKRFIIKYRKIIIFVFYLLNMYEARSKISCIFIFFIKKNSENLAGKLQGVSKNDEYGGIRKYKIKNKNSLIFRIFLDVNFKLGPRGWFYFVFDFRWKHYRFINRRYLIVRSIDQKHKKTEFDDICYQLSRYVIL